MTPLGQEVVERQKETQKFTMTRHDSAFEHTGFVCKSVDDVAIVGPITLNEKFRDTTMKFFVIVDLESKILILMKLDEIISLILMKTKWNAFFFLTDLDQTFRNT